SSHLLRFLPLWGLLKLRRVGNPPVGFSGTPGFGGLTIRRRLPTCPTKLHVKLASLLMPSGPIQVQGSSRAEREILHGRHLAVLETETVWGWGTPAGQLRARRRAGLIVEGARLSPGQRALEIGCGTGLFTEIFASRGAEIVAVDISGELLDKAR